jgi:hypothetical protein
LAEPETYDEVERLPGSGQLPGAPRCHRGRFSSSSWAASKERAAASVLEVRTPHRSSCSRRARKRRRPSTEIRLGVHLPLLARESSLAFVPQPPFACERDPPTERGMEKYKLHPRLTRGTFTDKGGPTKGGARLLAGWFFYEGTHKSGRVGQADGLLPERGPKKRDDRLLAPDGEWEGQ